MEQTAARKTVAIVGAGVSGLAACKYVLEEGLHPLVFEADAVLGGVWAHTIRSTRLQAVQDVYRFTDHPWPADVMDMYPESTSVMAYLQSYAEHFDLLPHIRFHARVVGVDYVGVAAEERAVWDLWNGTGEAFGDGRGKWHVTVQHTGEHPFSKIYQVDFLILCIGRFSGLPNMPSFPPDKGPEVFQGKVLHSMDYANLDHSSAAKLLKGKRITVVGFSKSAVDIVAECSHLNGISNPCMLLYRESRWIIPHYVAWGVPLQFLYLSRFAELSMHKPGEGLLLYVLAAFLLPLRWLISKFVESYFLWKLPLRKFGTVPNHSFTQEMAASKTALLPEGFYERVNEGSIILRRSPSFHFYKNGIASSGELIETDIVIFATGFDGSKKIKKIFTSPELQEMVMGSSYVTLPLYRECIHPRIPQLAIIGYSESLSNIHTSEMRCKWLGRFLRGRFQLPRIQSMEEDVLLWEKYMKQYCGCNSSVGTVHNWYMDRLYDDMGAYPPRNRGFLHDWFVPCMPADYGEL